MPRSYISAELRRLIANRANYSCEYCLIPDRICISFNAIPSDRNQ